MQEVLQRVHDNGHVYKGMYEGWYCPRCADFKTENEIEPTATRCPIHHIPLDARAGGELVLRAVDVPGAARGAVRRAARLRAARHARATRRCRSSSGGLQDVSLSRGKLTWGVPVPWDPTHVFYVWFDALLNYYTALGYARPGEDLTDRFWPATYHVIGKDILKFHTVFWPAMLMAAELPLPEHVFVHGFLLDGRRTQDVQVAGQRARPVRGHGQLRHRRAALLLCRDVQFGADGSVSIDAASSSATRASSPTSSATSPAARSRCSRRYRDGDVPGGGDPTLADEFDGLAERRSRRCSTAPSSPARSRRSGSACGG